MDFEIGTDIVATTRITNAVHKFGMRFLQRFLLPSEILLTYKHKNTLFDSTHIHSWKLDTNQNNLICKDSQNTIKNAQNMLHKNDIGMFPFYEDSAQKPQFFTQAQRDIYVAQTDSILQNLQQDFLPDTYRMDTIAGFWAMKEACAKALGVGIGEQLGFHDMCIFKDSYGKPHIALQQDAWFSFKVEKIAVSISHERDMVIAVCVVTFA